LKNRTTLVGTGTPWNSSLSEFQVPSQQTKSRFICERSGLFFGELSTSDALPIISTKQYLPKKI